MTNCAIRIKAEEIMKSAFKNLIDKNAVITAMQIQEAGDLYIRYIENNTSYLLECKPESPRVYKILLRQEATSSDIKNIFLEDRDKFEESFDESTDIELLIKSLLN